LSFHAVLLAAGASRRFGDTPPKQLATAFGEPLIRRTARTALACCLDGSLDGVHVVVGHRGDEVVAALAGLAVAIVPNPAWSQGKASSVRAGLAALPGEAEGALFLPCDQPLLTCEVLARLLATARRETARPPIEPRFIVVPVAPGPDGNPRRGAPVLFARAFFPELRTLSGDTGGREVLRRHPEAVREERFDDDLPLRDADTPEELATLLGASGS